LKIDRVPEDLASRCIRCNKSIFYLACKFAGRIFYMPTNPESLKVFDRYFIARYRAVLKFQPYQKGHVSHYLTCPIKPINYRFNFIKKQCKE
jgi:hypothetical protein